MKECRICRSPITDEEQYCRVCGAKCVPDAEKPSTASPIESSTNTNSIQSEKQGILDASFLKTESINNDIVVLTTDNIMNHEIINYLGIVSGRSLHHIILDNIYNEVEKKDEETIDLIEKADNSAIKQMIKRARDLGANAITGVNLQRTLDNGLLIVTYLGTAVIISLEEHKDTDGCSSNQEECLIPHDIDLEETHLEDRPESANESDEEEFLGQIADIDNILEIWHIWREYDLIKQYPEVDIILSQYKDEAQTTGIFTNEQLKKLKWILSELLTNNNDVVEVDDESIAPEIEFLNAVEEADNLSFIWELFKELDLHKKYPKAYVLLTNKMREEQKFGKFTKTQMNRLKRDLFSIIRV